MKGSAAGNERLRNFPRRYYPDRVRRVSLSLAATYRPRQSTPVSSRSLDHKRLAAKTREITGPGTWATRYRADAERSQNNARKNARSNAAHRRAKPMRRSTRKTMRAAARDRTRPGEFNMSRPDASDIMRDTQSVSRAGSGRRITDSGKRRPDRSRSGDRAARWPLHGIGYTD
jgi:hypothetical protein